ncbi:helix-turn-helix transcriptional regulator [Paenibacillus methanolicus]|uniref:Putative DNA-binding transcriptional regulator YafY n=1 Tax=Paenibacillus methanolicus TaxID=582686 RepID=A0A5S5BZZ3_9BACL|nr:YafY family protein [Paenibacillus methanolicus]TYP71938.1 putative DNA-binding transcriptional regulator YafY [Paenibacillus methanolicus]
MKLERLISIVYMLLNNEVVSASELAEKYEVSPRTIYRDIDAICAAGIPVVSYQGANGGYGIIESYKMDRSLLGSFDVASLITVLHSMSSIFDDERAMETVRRLQTIQKNDQLPHLSMDMGSHRVTYNESLRKLRDAITAKQVVRFDYINGKNERVARSVEPVSLRYQHDAWYLFSYCRTRGDYREFKISRMTDLLLQPERYERRHEASPQRSAFEQYRWNDHKEVVLQFSSEALARAMDLFYESDRSFNPDGSLTVTLKLDNAASEQWLLGVMMSFGDEAEIVAPIELRQALRRKLEKMLQRYREA